MKEGFLRRRIVRPILDLLRQGITPEKVALSVALGAVLGVFPVLGSTTLLCALAAVVLRLNLPSIQLVNYLVYPMQLVLLIPFMSMGGWLFGGGPPDLSVSAIVGMIRADAWHAVTSLWIATVRAIAAWLVAAPVPALALYFVLRTVLRRAAAFLPLSPGGAVVEEE